jgi:hypothetical protein
VWQYHAYTELPASNTGSGHAAVTGDVQGGTYGVTWVIDPTQTPVLNRAFRDWNTDFFSLLKVNGMSVVCSFSQELVQPPDNPAGGAVWVQRFPDGTAVETATGFGTLNSSQIAFSPGPQSYMGQAFAAMAGLMLAAGLTPKLQFGEILWWFLANASGWRFTIRTRRPPHSRCSAARWRLSTRRTTIRHSTPTRMPTSFGRLGARQE